MQRSSLDSFLENRSTVCKVYSLGGKNNVIVHVFKKCKACALKRMKGWIIIPPSIIRHIAYPDGTHKAGRTWQLHTERPQPRSFLPRWQQYKLYHVLEAILTCNVKYVFVIYITFGIFNSYQYKVNDSFGPQRRMTISVLMLSHCYITLYNTVPSNSLWFWILYLNLEKHTVSNRRSLLKQAVQPHFFSLQSSQWLDGIQFNCDLLL